MTISTTQNQLSYTGDGVSLAFAFPFPFIAVTDLKVLVGGVLQSVGYSVTGTAPIGGSGTFANGTVTFTSAPVVGAAILIYCDPDQLQSTSLPANDPFPSKTVEKMIDKLTLLIQRLSTKFGNALTFPIGEANSGVLPAAAARASALLSFDASGNPTVLFAVPSGSFVTGNAIVDRFTGNGATTVFTLSQNPGSQANLSVSIGGVVQTNGVDFTWAAGTTLTFTTAPPDTIAILVRYTNALGVGSTASSAVTFQQAGAGTVGASVEKELRYWLRPEQYGAVGDGVTDDTAALNAASVVAGAASRTLYLTGTYKVTATVTFSCDIVCDAAASLVPTTAVGANTPTVVIAASAYAVKRTISGLIVAGSAALRTALVNGIRVDCANCTLDRCSAYTLNYNWIVRMFSVTLRQCNGFLGNTNLSAYARDTSHEINALHVDGGNWDSAVNVALNIGDTSWGDAIAPGVNQHGVGIQIDGMPNFDGSQVRIDNVYGVRIGGYWEGIGTATEAIRLGGSGDGNCRNVEVLGGCYFSSMPHAIRCYSGINGLVVRPSFYTGVTKSALYLSSDIYAYRYEQGTASGSFAQGQEVHTGFRSLALSAVQFSGATIPHQGLFNGVQTLTSAVNNTGPSPTPQWYPGGTLQSSVPTVARMNASTAGRFYTTPLLTKAGTVAANVFTFTTLSDCYGFNGGDQITTAPAGATYIRSVDYVAGTAVLDGGSTANGAATISQIAAAFHSETVTYSGAAPASATWAKGDHCVNGNSTVGNPKGWYCTVAGTPGTWVSEGAL